MSDGKPAIFLDRDGTLIVETGYLHEPDKVELIPGAGEAVQRLAEGGFELFIVTNQAGIGRGYYAEEQMHAVNERVAVEFAKFGVAFHKIYFAPEAPDQPSRNRNRTQGWPVDISINYQRTFNVSCIITVTQR